MQLEVDFAGAVLRQGRVETFCDSDRRDRLGVRNAARAKAHHREDYTLIGRFVTDVLTGAALIVGGLMLMAIGLSLDQALDLWMQRHGWSIRRNGAVFRYYRAGTTQTEFERSAEDRP
jgi:hypothetical protein